MRPCRRCSPRTQADADVARLAKQLEGQARAVLTQGVCSVRPGAAAAAVGWRPSRGRPRGRRGGRARPRSSVAAGDAPARAPSSSASGTRRTRPPPLCRAARHARARHAARARAARTGTARPARARLCARRGAGSRPRGARLRFSSASRRRAASLDPDPERDQRLLVSELVRGQTVVHEHFASCLLHSAVFGRARGFKKHYAQRAPSGRGPPLSPRAAWPPSRSAPPPAKRRGTAARAPLQERAHASVEFPELDISLRDTEGVSFSVSVSSVSFTAVPRPDATASSSSSSSCVNSWRRR